MIQNLGKYAHARNPNKGRHAAGANPAPGSGIKPPNKSGQAEPASNKVTTASKTFGAPRNASTSMNSVSQAQSQVAANPAPFKNPAGVANASAPAVMPYGSTFKHRPGLQKSAAPRNPSAGPVGGGKPKTLSHMVGYKAVPPKKKGAMTASAKKGGHSLLYGD